MISQAPIKKRTGARVKVQRPLKGPLPAASGSGSHTIATPVTTEQSFDHENEDNESPFASFSSSKKDKARIKHSSFVNRIQKTTPAGSRRDGTGGVNKRRRPSKKLVAGLEGLLGALPDIDNGEGRGGDGDSDDEWAGLSEEEGTTTLHNINKIARIRRRKDTSSVTGTSTTDGKMQMKTLKSRPGAMKRKARLEGLERERFARNMAGMSGPTQVERSAGGADKQGADGADVNSRNKWAALRGFVSQTLETNPDFRK